MNTVERQEAAANTNPQARSSHSLRLLFMKGRLAWPRAAGHDVFCYHFMQALAEQGHAVSLATIDCPAPEAVQGLALERVELLDEPPAAEAGDSPPIGLSHMQERFRNYWGVKEDRVRAVGLVARACRADAVIVVGLNVLPYLGAVENALRVWYAADEWAWHHLSQVRLLRPSTWGNLKQAAVKGLYERAYAPLLDRVWVVSEADRRAMRRVAGVAGVDVCPTAWTPNTSPRGSGRSTPKSACSGAAWTSGPTSRRSNGSAGGFGRACGGRMPGRHDSRSTAFSRRRGRV